jgi:hypothetical protein
MPQLPSAWRFTKISNTCKGVRFSIMQTPDPFLRHAADLKVPRAVQLCRFFIPHAESSIRGTCLARRIQTANDARHACRGHRWLQRCVLGKFRASLASALRECGIAPQWHAMEDCLKDRRRSGITSLHFLGGMTLCSDATILSDLIISLIRQRLHNCARRSLARAERREGCASFPAAAPDCSNSGMNSGTGHSKGRPAGTGAAA